MNDGAVVVCIVKHVKLMLLPLLIYSSELPNILALDANGERQKQKSEKEEEEEKRINKI